MARKAAVVIGVDRTGNLTTLKSAANGARQVASWLRSEGFAVECLTDKDGPVKSRQVEDAISRFVTSPPRYHLLVVYFSGHGYWLARADRWLLSDAPTKTSEAINLEGAIDLARYSGIPNVVFISDACRSIPDSRAGAQVTGIDAFPNYPDLNNISKIDVFKATSEARSSYEGEIDGEYQSILTRALMSAYEEPEPHMVREVVEGAETFEVVPNRELEDYLQSKVNKILADIDINLTQNIEANVPSSDDVYISRIRGPAGAIARRGTGAGGPMGGADPSARKSIGDDAAMAIGRTLSARAVRRGGQKEVLAVSRPETEASLDRRLPGSDIDHFESQVGFVVHGAKIVNAVTTKGHRGATVELLEQGDGQDGSAVIRLWNVEPATSVAIQLEDGRCAILAALEGYIGHATFNSVGMSNVSYVPSSNHWRWQEYERDKEKIDRLRALVALAVEHRTFKVRSSREATSLGRKIRLAKGVDPTLGLYAAHAFSQAGKEEHVMSVLTYMSEDLSAALFDMKALASRQLGDRTWNLPVVPFCPMLTQTWNLLRPRGIELPPPLQEAGSHLCNSLWTTFQPGESDGIVLAIESGGLE